MMTAWERPVGVALRLVLIRHAEPEASAKGRCYGKLDVGLSEYGRRQMARVAEALESVSFDAVYASPRRRARESADIVASDVVVDERLGEIDFGELEGLTYEEAAKQYPYVYEQWMERPTEVTFPGGESFEEMRQRVVEAIDRIRADHREQTVAIVSHGGVNRILLAEALGIESRNIFHIGQSHAGVNVIDELDGFSIVRLMNGSC
jgi:alpha-ribazole phosphatase